MRCIPAVVITVLLACITVFSSGVSASSTPTENMIVSDVEFYTATEGANIISSDSRNGNLGQCIEYAGEPDFSTEGYTSNRSMYVQYIDADGNESGLTIHATMSLYCEEVVLTAEDELVVVGSFKGTSLLLNHTSNGYAGFSIAIDITTFNHQSYIFDTNGDDRFYGLTASSFGDFIFAGKTDGNISNFTTSTDVLCGVNSTTCGVVVFLNQNFEYNYLQYIESDDKVTCYDVEQKGESNDFLVTGYFSGSMTFNGSQINPPTNRGTSDLFVSILDSTKHWTGVNTVGSTGSFRPKDILHHQNEFILLGEGILDQTNPATVAPSQVQYSHGFGDTDLVILYVGNDGIIKDIQPIGTEGKDGSGEIEFFSTTSIVFSGYLGDEYSFNNSTIGVENTKNFFGGIYDFDSKLVTFAFSSDGSQESDARANTAVVLSNDSFYVGGRAEPFESTIHSIEVEGSDKSAVGIVFSIDSDSDQISDAADNCIFNYNTNQSDFDLDGQGDACDSDIDSDGVFNPEDICDYSDITQTDRDGDGCFFDEDSDRDGDGVNNSDDVCNGTESEILFDQDEDRDRDGCHDTIPGLFGEDQDDDGDSHKDWEDNCNSSDSVIYDSENWIDEDEDGCHDTLPGQWGEDTNDDNDAYNDHEDDCKDEFGTSDKLLKGCPDHDKDGYSDNGDTCMIDHGTSSERGNYGCPDDDNDGHANSYDKFPVDIGQWDDSDNDGYGDNPNRPNSDDCKDEFGTSDKLLKGCPDFDGDGWADSEDQLPLDSSDYLDSDSDKFGDSIDECPNEKGYSISDRKGCPDDDEDGYSNPDIIWTIEDGADAFLNDDTQWKDFDQDGYGDNENGQKADNCPQTSGISFEDRFGCPDEDGDGYSDPDSFWTTKDGADAFADDSTQWYDYDEDGFGDNEFGNTPDSCPSEHGTSNKNDIYGCPDSDNDGYSNDDDLCPGEEEECFSAITNGRAPLDVILRNLLALVSFTWLCWFIYRQMYPKKEG